MNPAAIREEAKRIITETRDRMLRKGADPVRLDVFIKIEKPRAYADALRNITSP